jgi:phosphoribosylformimino-5-aminoimidazole carboxamide ribotide isomerase
MRLIPVIDLKGGEVVRGIAGRRAEYRPWVSPLCGTSEPLAVARALAERAGARELYVADLDAIAGGPPAVGVYEGLIELGVALWVDAGLSRADDATPLICAGVEGLVVGLETATGPQVLNRLAERVGPGRVVFSLDLSDGRPLEGGPAWGKDAREVAEVAVRHGARRLIVLDVGRVGCAAGPGTEELCRWIADTYPAIEVIAGGGVRDRDDLKRLEHCGISAALVATALHEGRLP